jgi:hypothetical protein
MIVTPKVHVLSFIAGISSGALYGLIKSSRYTLEKYKFLNFRFESLGENYALGRLTMT